MQVTRADFFKLLATGAVSAQAVIAEVPIYRYGPMQYFLATAMKGPFPTPDITILHPKAEPTPQVAANKS